MYVAINAVNTLLMIGHYCVSIRFLLSMSNKPKDNSTVLNIVSSGQIRNALYISYRFFNRNGIKESRRGAHRLICARSRTSQKPFRWPKLALENGFY